MSFRWLRITSIKTVMLKSVTARYKCFNNIHCLYVFDMVAISRLPIVMIVCSVLALFLQLLDFVARIDWLKQLYEKQGP